MAILCSDDDKLTDDKSALYQKYKRATFRSSAYINTSYDKINSDSLS
jgi:hypothetical protein